ncbi:hypothetical protein [Aquipseudomonas alcaligenes]|uniref:Mu-like prophage FluMu N-terminal domain-containing protein n=1 Tax=Aquipseudomonas alcaligenes TaxID=43263 RepID=A0A1N6NDA4_AQUAC|nr:hypothetical protein [Pseudomonas alcaligenes]SIP90039.1 hypothetical protein SAMN05878282_101226 [Pseudomonas alcaligenes]
MAKRAAQPRPPVAGKDAAQPAATAPAEKLVPQPAGSTQDGASAPADSTGAAAAAATPNEHTASEPPPSDGTLAEDAAGTGQDALLNTAAQEATDVAAPIIPVPVAPMEQLGGAVESLSQLEAPAVTPPAKAVEGSEDDGEVEGLWITAIPEEGFRRCGYRFTREGFGIALSALTYGQIEQLVNEPMLKVEQGVFSGLVE